MSATPRPDATLHDPAHAAPGPVILLVDDDPDCRALVRDAIESLDLPCRVFECPNGIEGLRFIHGDGTYAQSPRPDLVILDLEMPGADGHAVLAQLRSDTRYRDLPVMVLTGVDDDDQERLALRHGANSYACKDRDAGTMMRKVTSAAEYWTTVHRALPPRSAAA